MKRSVLGTAKEPEVQEIQSSNSLDSLTTVELGRLMYGREGDVAVFSACATKKKSSPSFWWRATVARFESSRTNDRTSKQSLLEGLVSKPTTEVQWAPPSSVISTFNPTCRIPCLSSAKEIFLTVDVPTMFEVHVSPPFDVRKKAPWLPDTKPNISPAKAILSRSSPFGFWCFTCKLFPPSSDLAIFSSAPQTP